MQKNNQNSENIISFNYFKNLIKKKWILALSIIIIFMLLAFYNAFLKKNIYQVNFSIIPIELTIDNSSQSIIEVPALEIIINNFSINYEKIKDDLIKNNQINNSVSVKNFHKLSVAPSMSESGDKKNQSIEISLFVYDTTATRAIIFDLLKYINQNSLIKHLLAEKEMLLNKEKESLEIGLNNMIKYRDNFQSNQSNINIISYNLFKDIIQTQKEIENVNFHLKNIKAVEIIADAENPGKPKGLAPIKGFIIFTLLGIFFALCFIIIIDKLITKSE